MTARRLAALVCGGWLPLLASAAQAEIAPDLELGVGGFALLGGNFLDRPSDLSASPGSPVQLVYPGFAGVGGGAGLRAELRWQKILGLEIDLLFSSDHGFAYIDLVRVELGQTALHVPVLLKAYYPASVVSPALALGVDFVQPTTLSVSTSPLLAPSDTQIGSQAGPYAMLLVGAELEFKLPSEEADLRLPLSVRAGLNPSTPAAARDRAGYAFRPNEPLVVDSAIFSSEWQYQVHLTLGLSWNL